MSAPSSRARAAALHAAVLTAYAALAFFFCRPVGAHLFAKLLGPGGDASVTLWNIWHFRDAVLHRANPLWTDYQYWPAGGNLLMHQYTLFADLFAFPLVPWIGVTGAYNVHMLACLVAAGYLLFLFARDFGAGDGASFVAGAALAFHPFVGAVIDSGDGVCYQVMWPAVLFFWALARAMRDGRMRDCAVAALALTAQWAYSYYYFLYLALMAGVFYLVHERPLVPSFRRRDLLPRAAMRTLDAAALAAAAWALLSAVRGQREFHGHGSLRTLVLYVAPYLTLWTVLALRALSRWAVSVRFDRRAVEWRALKPFAATFGIYAALNLPLVGAILAGMRGGDYGTAPAPWRGGGNPTDLLQLVLPDAANPLWGGALAKLYAALGMAPASVSAVGVLLLAAAAWLWRRRPADRWLRLWYAASAFSFAFALGPWLKVYGVHTYLPLPFYPVHLLPFFNNIQHGLRFNAFAVLFLAPVLARALDALRAAAPAKTRALVLPAAFALLALESAPPARALSSLEAPPIAVRLGERPYGPLLTVPVGANFNGISGEGWRGHMALDLALQSVHRKPIVGGYLARVSLRAYRVFVDEPLIAGLLGCQDGGALPSAVTDREAAGRSLRDLRVRYVLVDGSRVPAELAAAVAHWPVRKLDAEGSWVLYEAEAR